MRLGGERLRLAAVLRVVGEQAGVVVRDHARRRTRDGTTV